MREPNCPGDAPIEASHVENRSSTTANGTAMKALLGFVAGRQRSLPAVGGLEAFEKQAHELFAAAEAEVIGDELAKLDVDQPSVVCQGETYRRVLRCEETYFIGGGIKVIHSAAATRAAALAGLPS